MVFVNTVVVELKTNLRPRTRNGDAMDETRKAMLEMTAALAAMKERMSQMDRKLDRLIRLRERS